MGKDKRTYKKVKAITEPIYNLAAFNTTRNYYDNKRRSKRANSSMLVLIEYVHNAGKKEK